jgi:hypothetical protein
LGVTDIKAAVAAMERDMKIGFTDGAGFDALSGQCDIVAIVIGRREVESGHVGDVVDRLMRLSDSRENVLRFESSVVVSFDGYDDDPRPVGAIPECVKFFRKVHAAWPFWYHFLVKDSGMFGVVLTLLMDTKVITSGKDVVVQEVGDEDSIRKTVLSLFGPMNILYETHRIGLEKNKLMTEEVCSVIGKCMR